MYAWEREYSNSLYEPQKRSEREGLQSDVWLGMSRDSFNTWHVSFQLTTHLFRGSYLVFQLCTWVQKKVCEKGVTERARCVTWNETWLVPYDMSHSNLPHTSFEADISCSNFVYESQERCARKGSTEMCHVVWGRSCMDDRESILILYMSLKRGVSETASKEICNVEWDRSCMDERESILPLYMSLKRGVSERGPA